MGRKKSRPSEYPFAAVLDEEAFEQAAKALRLSRQQRRVTYGRLAHYSLSEIAFLMRLSRETVKKYSSSARERAGCGDLGEFHRKVLRLMDDCD